MVDETFPSEMVLSDADGFYLPAPIIVCECECLREVGPTQGFIAFPVIDLHRVFSVA
jgi:hypothetical protein